MIPHSIPLYLSTSLTLSDHLHVFPTDQVVTHDQARWGVLRKSASLYDPTRNRLLREGSMDMMEARQERDHRTWQIILKPAVMKHSSSV